jgi:hypothetical protein
MSNAVEDTPTGADAAVTTEQLGQRSLGREIARTMESLGELARVQERGGVPNDAAAARIAAIERRLGDLAHETARYHEALADDTRALIEEQHKTHRELVAIRDDVRVGRLRPSHVMALACACGLAAVAAFTGTWAFLGPFAGGIVTLVGRDLFRRRRE